MATTIEVQDDTWRQLNRLKEPGETFDEVINRVALNGGGSDGE